MDRHLKMPWDLDEIEAAAGVAVGPRVAGYQHCSVDLKLGGLGEFGDGKEDLETKAASAPETSASSLPSSSSASSPLKRPRPSANAVAYQCPPCAVDGCRADLSKCREYHRRHKVCQAHSKTPVVMVNGREMRFCQQCSRFHMLAEFDETKRSCRKRLDCHNRRRRKPQLETTGPGFLSYPPAFASGRADLSWPVVIDHHTTLPLHGDNHRQFTVSFPGYSKESRQFTFLQDASTSLSGSLDPEAAPLCPAHLNAVTPLESSLGCNLYHDGLTQVLESDCALSLLSSPAQPSGINESHAVESIGEPLVSNQQFNGIPWFPSSQSSGAASATAFPTGPWAEDERLSSILAANSGGTEMSCDTSLLYQAASQPHHFSWQQ